MPSLTIDLDQVQKHLGLLYEPGDQFFLGWYDDSKKTKGLPTRHVGYIGPSTVY